MVKKIQRIYQRKNMIVIYRFVFSNFVFVANKKMSK